MEESACRNARQVLGSRCGKAEATSNAGNLAGIARHASPHPALLQDKWHHEEDVIAGFCLGFLMAWLFYRQAYASVMGPHAGMLTSAVRGSSGGRLAASNSSSRLPLYGGSEGSDEQALYASADDKV